MLGKPIETSDLIMWEFIDYGWSARELLWDWPRPSVCGWQLWGFVFCGVSISGTTTCHWCVSWPLKSIYCDGMPSSTLMPQVGDWSWHNLICNSWFLWDALSDLNEDKELLGGWGLMEEGNGVEKKEESAVGM